MTEMDWETLVATVRHDGNEDWLRAEMEERIRLGDSLIVTGVPPSGGRQIFRDAEEFCHWYAELRATPMR